MLCKLAIPLPLSPKVQQPLQMKSVKQVLHLRLILHQRRPYAHSRNVASSLDVDELDCQKISYPDPRSRLNHSLQLLVNALIFLSSHRLYRKQMDFLIQKVHKDPLHLSLRLRKLKRICLLHLICQNPCSLLVALRIRQIRQGT